MMPVKISAAYTPPPPEGFVSPVTWGVEDHVRERFGQGGHCDLLGKRGLAGAGQDEVQAARQGAADGLRRVPTHQNGAPERARLEPTQIGRQMPGQGVRAAAPQDAVSVDGGEQHQGTGGLGRVHGVSLGAGHVTPGMGVGQGGRCG